MSNDLNLCQFIGRLGKDPDIRYMPSGGAVANFSIACGSTYKDKQTGEKVENTEWIRVSAFGKLAEIIGEYVKKGSMIYISGRMQTRKWTGKDGKENYTTEIVANSLQMLGGKPQQQQPANQQGGQEQHPAQQREPGSDDFNDDIPF